MNRKSLYFSGFILLLTFLLVFITACSSSYSSPTPTQATVSRAPSTTPTNIGTAPVSSVLPTDTMFAYFLSNGNLTIFATALTSTNLVAELKGKGPYTAFVPTDEAFLKVPPLQKDAIFKDTAKLKELILYHFVQGEYPASKLTPGTSLKTLQGESLQVKISNYQPTVNDANFVLTDVPANDGVFHIIDKVLMPSSLSAP